MWFVATRKQVCRQVSSRGCGAAKPSLTAAPHPRGPSPRYTPSGRSSGVEHDLAKVGVEGSNPFARSSVPGRSRYNLSTGGTEPPSVCALRPTGLRVFVSLCSFQRFRSFVQSLDRRCRIRGLSSLRFDRESVDEVRIIRLLAPRGRGPEIRVNAGSVWAPLWTVASPPASAWRPPFSRELVWP